jgi:hypothetical protein
LEGLHAPKSVVRILKESNRGSTSRRGSVSAQSLAVSSPSAGECTHSVFGHSGCGRRCEASRSKRADESSEVGLSENRATNVQNERIGSSVAECLFGGCQTHPCENHKTVIRHAREVEAKLGKSNKADGIGDAHHFVPDPRNRDRYDPPGKDWSYWFFIGRRSNTFRTIARDIVVSRLVANRSRSPERRLCLRARRHREARTRVYSRPSVRRPLDPPAAKPSHDTMANDNSTQSFRRTDEQSTSQHHHTSVEQGGA